MAQHELIHHMHSEGAKGAMLVEPDQRVMLVLAGEDERRAVKRLLAAEAPRLPVTECADSGSALAAAAKDLYACVVLGDQLPGTTALEFLPKLLASVQGAPVIVLTSHGDELTAVELMKAGAADYLPRDRVGSGGLARAVAQALALAEARRQLDAAQRAQRVYLARLRSVVELSPRLFSERTVEARAEIALLGAHALFGAEESFLGLHGGTPFLHKTLGDGLLPLDADDQDWHELFAETHPSDHPRLVVRATKAGGQCYVMRLLSHDEPLGVLAMRLPSTGPTFQELTEPLFNQLGDLITVAIDNARLFETTTRAVGARDAIIAVVSHDLRSPLNSFRMGVELLRGDHVSSKEAVLLRMDRAVLSMNRLIDDLLDVARIEHGQLPVALTPIPVSALLEDIIAVQVPVAAAAGITLAVREAPDVRVVADRGRVAQLLANLVSNAIKASSKDGKIFVDVVEDNGDVVFSVTDHGPGVPHELRPRVFDRYYRKGGRGLGLGLYIAKAIVDAHSGRIWIDDAPEGGSSFRFTLRSVQ